jgi:hypothetical protein
MSETQELQLARQMIEDTKPIVVGVGSSLLEQGGFGDLGVLIQVARSENLVSRLVGRVVILFPDFDDDPREVAEIPECRDWLLALEGKVPYLAVLLHPTSTFKLLLLCHVPWTKDPDEDYVVPDEEQAVAFLLDAGMTAYTFACRQDLEPRAFTREFLQRVGMENVVDDTLLDEYERVYRESNN